ncbi:MAG: hypothetical protein WDN69_15160 [Aliidongia sp.]
MLKRPTRWIATLLICAILGSFPAGAHDLPLDRIMNGFVKIEPHEAHLVVRVPLDLLRAVPLPLDGDRYDIAAANPAVEKVLGALGNDFTLRENGVRLGERRSARAVERRRSPVPARRPFAPDLRHGRRPYCRSPDPDMAISFELGYLDAHFTYPISSPAAVFTIGTSVAADLQGTAKLTLRYLPLDDVGRAFIISSEDGDVAPRPGLVSGIRRLHPARHRTYPKRRRPPAVPAMPGHPVRRIVPLVPVITAFTLGHSVTLIGTAYNLAPAAPGSRP